MAAGDSIVSICNIGLIALGEDPIASLEDQRKAAILCAARYDQVRRAVLRSALWNCAKRRAAIPASATPPAFGFANAYPLPADYLRVFELTQDPRALYDIESGELLTDVGAPLQLIYIWDLQDPTRFDAILTEAIGYAMAEALARPLTGSADMKAEMRATVEARLAVARGASSSEKASREWDVDVWLGQRS